MIPRSHYVLASIFSLLFAVSAAAQPVDLKIIVTFSEGSDDVFAAPQPGVRVLVNGSEVVTGDSGFVRTQVPPGPTTVGVHPDQLGDPQLYKIAFVGIAPTGTGVLRRCQPTDDTGAVTFLADSAEGGEGSASDYEVGLRGVPVDAAPTTNVVECSAGTTSTTFAGCPANGTFTQCHGGKPTITSFVVPPVMPEGRIAPVNVSFSDPGGAVSSVLLEENLGGVVDIWRELAVTPFAPIPDQGTVTIGIICATGITTGGLPGFNRKNILRATATDVENVSSDPSASVTYKCVAKAFATKMAGAVAETLAVGAIVTAAVSAGTSIIPHPGVQGGSKLLAVLATALKFYKGVVEAWNSDPPDPNFTVVAEPAPPALVLLAAGEAPTPELANGANALAGGYAEAVGVADALLRSYERAQGAGEGRDLEWFRTQMDAAGRFAAAWAAALQRHGALAADLQAAWQAAGLPEVSLTVAQIQALQADVAANGPSEAFRALLLAAGADQETIDVLADAIVGADANAVAAASFPATLTSPAMAAGIQEAVEGFGRFAGAFTECQCDDANPCTDDACTDGACRNAPRPGTDGVACLLGTLAPPCDAPLPKALGAGLDKARRLADSAVADPAKARKLLGKAQKALAKAGKAAAKAKRKGKLPADCADAFIASVEELRARIKGLRAS